MYTGVFNDMPLNCSYDKNNEDITFHSFKIVWLNENNTMFVQSQLIKHYSTLFFID